MKKRIWGRFGDTSGESHKADQSNRALHASLVEVPLIPIHGRKLRKHLENVDFFCNFVFANTHLYNYT